MAKTQSRSRIGIFVFLFLILTCLFISFFILIPGIIYSRTEQAFGTPVPQLSVPRHLYLSTLLLLHSDALTQPVNPNGAETSFTIDPGESVQSITENLFQAHLITNPGVFRSYLQYTGMDTRLKAGEFTLSPAMSPIEIAQSIQSSISADITLTILPGWRLEEIANTLSSSGLTISADEFINATHSHPEGYSFSTCLADNSLEGFLFPGSYTVPRQTTINELLPQILMNFESQVTPVLRNGFITQGVDLCQAVILASIVQREAVLEEEMPLIASVFYNRFNSGSVLASDPTVQYALGYNHDQGTWWTNPLSSQDLQVNSPYNTYLYQGFPPGPISNPGLAALKAVASPAQTDFYYFRAACDGSGRHLFAQTYAEHLANECP